ncbi:MAG: polyamine aminopropyltransferase [Deltaproteobacteria bacterium]|nr:polyamine aminopropyltransferase [Deltaproteobacteria bacterium]
MGEAIGEPIDTIEKGEGPAKEPVPLHTPPKRRVWGPPAVLPAPEPEHIPAKTTATLLLVTVLVIATCGLVYELLASTLASYVLGDAVLQYSTVIGVYLSAMGIGAWLSGRVERDVARVFVEIEIAVALVGGISAPILFLAFAHLSWFRVVLYGIVLIIGTLVGMEIPLLLRILRERYAFKDLVARVLTVDYLGALVGSLAFPIFFVPRLGLVRTSLVIGGINALTAIASTWLLAEEVKERVSLRVRAGFVLALLIAGIIGADRITLLAEEGLFADEIVYAKQTTYQRIVVTRGRSTFQLFLNGNLQFSSADEYRYHEALVWPAIAARAEAGLPTKNALVLGGGDGLALRDLLKHPGLERVTLVDLDPGMTGLAKSFPLLRNLNEGSLHDPRVKVVNDDAYVWLADEKNAQTYDIVLADFPDPNHYALGKLYTTRMYALMKKKLGPGGIIAVQSTSPLFARKSYWCIARTMEKAGLEIAPYHVFVPSFGEWGFTLARAAGTYATPLTPSRLPELPFKLRYLDDPSLRQLFVLARDMASLDVEINRLDNQVLVHYYEAEWKRYL